MPGASERPDRRQTTTNYPLTTAMNMQFERKLTIPMEVKKMYPLTGTLADTVADRAAALRAIFTGQSSKLLLIIGPCSADDPDAVLDYCTRLRKVQTQVADQMLIVPRVYSNKPRTKGDGYMGLLHQPIADGKPDLFQGILAVRQLHLQVLAATGFTCADELLYPENYRYVDDLLAYVTVGARSVENQQHRLTASGLDIPVGMKNPTSGALTPMLNAIAAAQKPHSFLYRGWEVHSSGNDLAHAVLRGYHNEDGQPISNYDAAVLQRLLEGYASEQLQNPAVIIDVNHDNSGKNPLAQPEIVRRGLALRKADPAFKRLIKGFMVESYLVDGAQEPGGGTYGQSITDPCLGWEKTERLILDLAEAL